MTYINWKNKYDEDEDNDEIIGQSNVKLVMSKKLKEKIDYLSTEFTKSEIGGFLTYSEIEHKDNQVRIVLDDLLIPPQEATTGEVDIDGVGQIELRKEYGDKCLKIIGHWHSHHTMGSFFSSTDEEMMKNYSENKQFSIFIVSSKGEHLIRLVLKNNPFELKIENVEYYVETDNTIALEMEEEIKKKVKEPVIVTTTTSGYKNDYKSNYNNEYKKIKKDIESRVRYYQHQNHKVKIEKIFIYYGSLIETEFKILNPVISPLPDKEHCDVIVELGDKNKAKEFMVDVKQFLVKTLMLEKEKLEAEKDEAKKYECDELEDCLSEEELLNILEDEELEEEREVGFSGRSSWDNYRNKELMNRNYDNYINYHY